MKVAKYVEGEWFGVPLKDGAYGAGLISRISPGAALLGFFFGPSSVSLPHLRSYADAKPRDAVLVRRFSDLYLKNGRWPLLGVLEQWDRNEWSATEFVRQDPLRGKLFIEIYDSEDPAKHLRSVAVAEADSATLPRDGLSGAGSIEIRLSKLLSGSA